MIPFPEVFAYQEPVDGKVFVATFGGDLRLPGALNDGRTIVVALSDEFDDIGSARPTVAPEQVLDETREASAAAELAGSVFGEDAGTADGHGETVEEFFDPFAGEPEPEFGGRDCVDVETGERV